MKTANDVLLEILAIVNNNTNDNALSQIIACIDPWPLGDSPQSVQPVAEEHVFLAVKNLAARHCKREPDRSRIYTLLGVCETQEDAEARCKVDEDAYHEDFPGYRFYGEKPMYEWEVQKHSFATRSSVAQPVEVQRVPLGMQPDYPAGHVMRDWTKGWNDCLKAVDSIKPASSE